MLLPDHHYIKAESLADCLKRLNESGERAQLVGGGTDVIFNMRLKLFRPDVAVSVRGLQELSEIEELENGGLRIGAACRLADLARHERIQARYPAFEESINAEITRRNALLDLDRILPSSQYRIPVSNGFQAFQDSCSEPPSDDEEEIPKSANPSLTLESS